MAGEPHGGFRNGFGLFKLSASWGQQGGDGGAREAGCALPAPR